MPIYYFTLLYFIFAYDKNMKKIYRHLDKFIVFAINDFLI